jgi:replication-associated recombination protein RarA
MFSPYPDSMALRSRSKVTISYGQGYKFAHDHPGNFVAQDYLEVDKIFYEPTEQGVEKQIKERLGNWRKQFKEIRRESGNPPVDGNSGM